MKKLTGNTGEKKKCRRGDDVFVGLAQMVLDQSHDHHHFQLVEEDGTPCSTASSVEARLKALVIQEKPKKGKRLCHVTVVSTYCIKNKCPNADKIQRKILSNIIKVLDGNVHTRIWCDFCKQAKAFAEIIPRLLEKHPNKHFTLLHPVTKAQCTNDTEIMTALHAYRALQPKTPPTDLKVFAKSTHATAEGVCKCTEFVKEYNRLDHIAFNLEDGPATRVWSPQCAKSNKSANAKALYPKGQNTTHNAESTRQTILAQIKEFSASSIIFDNIQQHRVYDVLIRKASDTLGAATQLVSGIRGKNGNSASLGKMTAKVIDVLESGALFIAQEMSRDGKSLLRVLVLPPSALSRVKEIKAKYLPFSSSFVETFKEFVFDCRQPEQMQKMAELIEAHLADPTSLRMDMRTANIHMDSFTNFLEHIGIEAILKNHYQDEGAGVSVVDSCQGDFVAFQKLVEVKTLHLILSGNLYCTSIKPMPGVDHLLCLVLADDVRTKTRLLFDELQDRRMQRLTCDDLISDLEKMCDAHVIDGVFKFVDPASSVRQCPNDKPDIYFSMSQIDGKVVKSEYIYDLNKASYIDTRHVANRDLLQLILKNHV